MILNPLVSVIIPTFNRSDFICIAVDSVLKQTGCLFEIIVVDDGSTDGTEDVLRDYIEKGLITYLRQQNKGSSAARNLGINCSKGEYLCFLDADDFLHENSIQDRLFAYKSHPDIGLLFTDFKEVTLGDNKQVIHCNEFTRKSINEIDAKNYIKSVKQNIYLYHKEICYDPLVLRRLIWTCTVMIPKKVFDDVGYFKEELRVAQDIDLWFRIARKYRIAFLSVCTATYVLHAGGITKNIPLYYNSTIKVLSQYFDSIYKLPKIYKKKLRKKISSYYFTIGYYYYQKKLYSEAGRYFRQSFIYNKLYLSHYKYVAVTFLPDVVIDAIRDIRRYLYRLITAALERRPQSGL